jgi:hypothetical protein
MEVGDGTARILSHVEQQPVAATGDSLKPSDFSRSHHELGEQLAVVGTERRCVRDMSARNNLHVHRSLRVDITKGKHLIGAV